MSQPIAQVESAEGFTERECQANYSSQCSAHGNKCSEVVHVPTEMDAFLTMTGEIKHTEGLIWDRALKSSTSIFPDGRFAVNLTANGFDGVNVYPVDAGGRRHQLHIVQPLQDDIKHGRDFRPFSCFTLATWKEADVLRSKFPGRMMTPTAIVISSDQKSMQLSTSHIDDGLAAPAGLKLSLYPPQWDGTWYSPEPAECDYEVADQTAYEQTMEEGLLTTGFMLSNPPSADDDAWYNPKPVGGEDAQMTDEQSTQRWTQETDAQMIQRLGELGWDNSDFSRFLPPR